MSLQNKMRNDGLHSDLTDLIIRTYYDVYNSLGYGFLEKVYENTMYYELKAKKLSCEVQKPINVYHKGNTNCLLKRPRCRWL